MIGLSTYRNCTGQNDRINDGVAFRVNDQSVMMKAHIVGCLRIRAHGDISHPKHQPAAEFFRKGVKDPSGTQTTLQMNNPRTTTSTSHSPNQRRKCVAMNKHV